MRTLRTLVFAAVAGTAAAGGLAVAGIDTSIVTAPLVEEEAEDPHLASPHIAPAPTPGSLPLDGVLVYGIATVEAEAELDLSFVNEQRRLTRDEVKLLARVAGWPEHALDQLAEVAWCESRFDPRATNGDVLGLMQVHRMWFRYGGIDIEQWANPIVNLEAALVAYNYDLGRGYAPWTQWQCRPGGRYITAGEHNPERPEVLAAADGTPEALETEAPATSTSDDADTPSPTPIGDATPTGADPDGTTTPEPGGDDGNEPVQRPGGTVEPPTPTASPDAAEQT